MNLEQIGLIGYGEVGKIFSASLKKLLGVAVLCVWDVTLTHPANMAKGADWQDVADRLLAARPQPADGA